MKKVIILLVVLNLIVLGVFLKQRGFTKEDPSAHLASPHQPANTRETIVQIDQNLKNKEGISEGDFNTLVQAIQNNSSIDDKKIILNRTMSLVCLSRVTKFDESQQARLVPVIESELASVEKIRSIAKTSPDAVYRKIPDGNLYYCLILSGKINDKRIVPLVLPYMNHANPKIQQLAKAALSSEGYRG